MKTKAHRLLRSDDGCWIDRRGEVISTANAEVAGDKARTLSRRAQAMLAAAGMTEPDRQWYVIRVDYKQEKAVDKLLHDAGIEAWLPMQKIDPKRRSKRRNAPADPTYHVAWPGYMFVRIADSAYAWLGVAGVKHVRSVLGYGERPITVSPSEIMRLRCLLEKDAEAGKAQALAFTEGQKIRVIDGPFASFPGTVNRLDEFRAVIELMIFGRSTLVDLELAQVAKAR